MLAPQKKGFACLLGLSGRAPRWALRLCSRARDYARERQAQGGYSERRAFRVVCVFIFVFFSFFIYMNVCLY